MKKLVASASLISLLAPAALGVMAADHTTGSVINGIMSDEAELKVDVKGGELGIAFSDNIDLEKGEITRPTEAKVDFGTVDLGTVGNTVSIERKLPAITFQDARGTGEGYEIKIAIDKHLESKTASPLVNDNFVIHTANSIAELVGSDKGHTVEGVSADDTIEDASSAVTIYKADKSEGKGLYEAKEDEQKLVLNLDTTELEADATYTTTATVSIVPLVGAG